MMRIEQLETAIEQLESILVAVVALKPVENDVARLDRIYNAIANAKTELLRLAGFDFCSLD